VGLSGLTRPPRGDMASGVDEFAQLPQVITHGLSELYESNSKSTIHSIPPQPTYVDVEKIGSFVLIHQLRFDGH
jgi:hypothetical protein